MYAKLGRPVVTSQHPNNYASRAARPRPRPGIDPRLTAPEAEPSAPAAAMGPPLPSYMHEARRSTGQGQQGSRSVMAISDVPASDGVLVPLANVTSGGREEQTFPPSYAEIGT